MRKIYVTWSLQEDWCNGSLPEDKNHTWKAPNDPGTNDGINTAELFSQKYYLPYITSVREAIGSGNWNVPDQQVMEISKYQQEYGGASLMSPTQVNLEILPNKMNVFSRLSMYYGVIGLLILIVFFTSIFKPDFFNQMAFWNWSPGP